jgi:hypothetical protein
MPHWPGATRQDGGSSASSARSKAVSSARLEKGFERGQGLRDDASVWNQIGKAITVVIERGQRALEEIGGNAGPILAPVSNNSAAIRGDRAASWS